MNISKLFISVVLSLSLLVSALPTVTYAAEVDPQLDKFITLSADSAEVGGVIEVNVEGNPADATYQWYRADKRYGTIVGGYETVKAACTEISGATGATYTITNEDIGKYIRCKVTVNGEEKFSQSAFAVGNLALNASAWGYIADGNTMITDNGMWNSGTAAPDNLFDSNYYTAYFSLLHEKGDNATRVFLIDLGEKKSFDHIFLRVMFSPKGQKYGIYSADTKEELAVRSDAYMILSDASPVRIEPGVGSGWHDAYEFDFSPVNNRYVMLVMSGNVGSLARIFEIEVHSKYNSDTFKIDLAGSSDATLALGEPYVEEGFDVSDTQGYYAARNVTDFAKESTKTATVYETDSAGNRLSLVSGPVPLGSLSLDTTRIGYFEIEYNVQDVYGNAAAPVSRRVEVKSGTPAEGDLAHGKAESASSSDGSKHLSTDGSRGTGWSPEPGDTEPWLTVDLGEPKLVSKLKLIAEGITSYTLYGSDDNLTWTAVATGTQAEPDFAPVKYRYFRLSPVGSGIILKELYLYITPKGKAQDAARAITLASAAIENDMILPTSGLHGAAITWSSSDETILTKDGNIASRKTTDVTVDLTATVSLTEPEVTWAPSDGSASRVFAITIKGKPATSNSGSNSGSSSGGGGGGYSPSTPPLPDNTAIPNDYAAGPSAGTQGFSDVPSDHWAGEYITQLAKWGIVSGMGDGSFEPDTVVKREQLVKMIAEALGLTPKGEIGFGDVAPDEWYTPYIIAAVESGIINGISDTAFGIGGDISRQDMCVIVYRAMQNLKPGLFEALEPQSFADQDLMADYASEAIGMLKALGLVDGVGGGCFAPTEPVSRAQAAKILYFMIEQVGSR